MARLKNGTYSWDVSSFFIFGEDKVDLLSLGSWVWCWAFCMSFWYNFLTDRQNVMCWTEVQLVTLNLNGI